MDEGQLSQQSSDLWVLEEKGSSPLGETMLDKLLHEQVQRKF